jgi:glycosyltransferase involved in cell wall biosynthesis
MSTNKKISIIISVLNAHKTLKACLESIINQNFTDWELIIIDGGSTDPTLEIIKDYSEFLSYWISEKDTGIYNAWNKALKKSNGEWICFIGSDDILLPNSLENLYKLANINDVNFICSRVMMVNESGINVGAIGKRWNYYNFKNGLGIVHCGALHHKSLFYENYFDETYKIAGDFEFLLRVGKFIKPAFLNEITVEMCNSGVSRRSINKVILETSLAIYSSNEFNKIYGLRYFISAHLRNIIRRVIFLFPFGNELFIFKNSYTR